MKQFDINQLKKCDIHQIKLELIKVPVLLGYPAQIYFEAERVFPNHGLWSTFGGCLIAIDANEQVANEIKDEVGVCNECTRSAEKYLEMNR